MLFQAVVSGGDGSVAVAQVVKSSEGRRLAVEVTGAPAGSTVVFLLHGTPGSLSGPRPRGIYLHRRGIRLITYNRPGYPGSDRHEWRRVAEAAVDVEAIADHFGIDEFSVIGRSGGAPHALACAAAPSLRGRIACVAVLSSLAPYDAEGLDWFDGMAESNVHAYRDLVRYQPALVETLGQHAEKVRENSQGLLNVLWPELAAADRQAIGHIALRRLIAQTHAEALRESVYGWVDDVVALGNSWGFGLSGIKAPVLLWHGADDVFSPPSHTEWLAKQIGSATHYNPRQTAHFGAVEIVPEILSWILGQVRTAGPGRGLWSGATPEWLPDGTDPHAALVGSGGVRQFCR